MALNPEAATAGEVAKIIGNDSWAGPRACFECGGQRQQTIQFSDQDDAFELCLLCIRKAHKLIGK